VKSYNEALQTQGEFMADLGEMAEKRAVEFLRKQGYQIIAQNYRWRGGEIDIIARDGDFLVFVEVKARSSMNYGLPEEAITEQKKQKLIATAQRYIAQHKPELDMRFDVVAISGGQARLYKDAFRAL